jgi:hypothetical protein
MPFCPYCDSHMTHDTLSNTLGDWYCPEGCQRCCAHDLVGGELVQCEEKMADGDEVDGCIAHNWIAAVEDMKASDFSMEAQLRVSRWRKRLDELEKERAA